MRTTIYAAAAAAGLLLSTPATAATSNFDDIPNTGNAVQSGTVTSGGLDFNGAHYHIIDSADTRVVRNASTSYLAAEAAQGLGRPVTFGLTGGGLFTLNSIDVAEIWLPGEPLNDFLEVTFLGQQGGGGGLLSQSFTLDGLRDGAGGIADFQTVLFAGWTNMQFVTVSGRNANGAFGDYAIDNIVFNDDGAVPEPATWALLILGFGMVGHRIRQRRRPRLIFMQS